MEGSMEEKKNEEEIDLAPNVPKIKDAALNRRTSVGEKVSEALGMSHITKDPEYKSVLTELEEFEKGIKTFKLALSLYTERLRAAVDASSSVRVLASQCFGPGIGSKLEEWAEARSKVESTTSSDAMALAGKLKSAIEKYEKELKLTREATNKATMKARRDFEHYEAKVATLTQQVLNAENDLAKRAVRDKRAREEAEAKNLPPPEKTHYFFEDSNDVAAAKLDRLKEKLKRNEDKLEVARVWNERTHVYGKLSFKTLVEGCEADVKGLILALVDLDKTIAGTFAEALPTYEAAVSTFSADSSEAALNERLAIAKVEAGYSKDDVAAQDTLDHDDEEDDTLSKHVCGISF